MLLPASALLLFLVLSAQDATAMFSRGCREAAAQNIDWSGTQYAASDERCTKPLCGRVPQTSQTFNQRLSPQCKNLLHQYRSNWSRRGVSNLLTDQHVCLVAHGATQPSVPIMVSNEEISSFVMCTIPKAGCTNFRKLISTLITHPEPMPTNSFEQFQQVHFWAYPSVWHYDSSDSSCDVDLGNPAGSIQNGAERAQTFPHRLPASIPSFTVGRNPYIRVVSGFLDKMLHNPKRADQWTGSSTNTAMGVHGAKRWVDSVASFREFVKTLNIKGVHRQCLRNTRTYSGTASPSRGFGHGSYYKVGWFKGRMNKDNAARPREQTLRRTTMQTSLRDVSACFLVPAHPGGLRGRSSLSNEHFAVQCMHCSRSFRMDYYLRLEDMEEWFPCWMHGLGMRNFTETGWTDSRHGRMHIGDGKHWITTTPPDNAPAILNRKKPRRLQQVLKTGDKCWWSPKDKTCKEYYASFTRPDGTVVPGGQQDSNHQRSLKGRKRDQHDRNAAAKWKRYYDQETADIIYNLYYEDFKLFGYKKFVVPGQQETRLQ